MDRPAMTAVHPLGLPASLHHARPLVMGVLNVTPDSFSDGGRWSDPIHAIAHGRELHEAGADVVDVGGESTRPGAMRVAPEDELARVLPVIRALVDAGVPVSIDTMRAQVAQAAVDAGACLVNDVSGGLADPDMLAMIASLSVPYIVMHWRGPSDVMGRFAAYDDPVADVRRELADRLRAAESIGIDPRRIVVDPGLGFAKDAEHNWALLRGLAQIRALGHPVLVGASRKRFLGELLGGRPVDERDAATDAISALCAAAGVWAVRVHDVAGSRDAVTVGAAWAGAINDIA
jgi:dihydropteroate synthase